MRNPESPYPGRRMAGLLALSMATAVLPSELSPLSRVRESRVPSCTHR